MSTPAVESHRGLTKLQQIILEYIYTRQASYSRPVSSAVLARALQISWTHAREQAHELVKKGLLDVRSGPGGGYFPASPTGSGLTRLYSLASSAAQADGPVHGLVGELQATAAELAALARTLWLADLFGSGDEARGRHVETQADRLVEALQRLRLSARQAREATAWEVTRRSPADFSG